MTLELGRCRYAAFWMCHIGAKLSTHKLLFFGFFVKSLHGGLNMSNSGIKPRAGSKIEEQISVQIMQIFIRISLWITPISNKDETMHQKSKIRASTSGTTKQLLMPGTQLSKHFDVMHLISVGGFGQVPLLRSEAFCLEEINCAVRQSYAKIAHVPVPNYYGYGETGSLNQYYSDVKPGNFCIGLQMQGLQRLYLVDFGMARHFVSPSGMLKSRRQCSSFHGTVRYASLTTHRHEVSHPTTLILFAPD
ncbi:unnamed protein product [Gongylonema pulchrum]|uniref:Protein kinase domain-containing protein n=1 Tax=Gongylonema pulchrum TaxID=637853 RepID=A0A183CZC9_9BILA|nr:unnamed protein product [Gongylonema pulchrum]